MFWGLVADLLIADRVAAGLREWHQERDGYAEQRQPNWEEAYK
jgi:hypothetical protein